MHFSVARAKHLRRACLTAGLLSAAIACALILSGCKVDLPKELGQDDSWTIEAYQHGSPGTPKTVGKGSLERQRLLVWAGQNVNGWSLAIQSYAPDVYVVGRSFRLNIRPNFVVFGSGYLQYSKEISADDYQRLRAELTGAVTRPGF